ncbi:hypothetical protein AAC387_Pa06g2144 [Persea americana]|eukprot:TRINITY_DN30720_c0_g1_i2.p1 TRINITY_DN30720_c0_g1~~TRINITY_DN30720_c0_g1_i2.p1  ORF type:complete len:156 (-),score=42.62 TRINITY_DN30720_c0_g1_i2:218-685(-)
MGDLDEESLKRSEMSDSFALDMETLLHVADVDVTSNTNRALQRSLSRKGYQRGGEMKSSERETTDASSQGGLTAEKAAIDVPPEWAPSTVSNNATEEIRLRRYSRCNSNVSRRSSWIDPRKVLLFFATLSSMGTLILLYFTLSISNINEDGPQTQ